MMRAVLIVCLLAVAAAMLLLAKVMRYQYLSATGPALVAGGGSVTVIRRVDRWTGTPQIWACYDVDTNRVADVPPPPNEASYTSGAAGDVDAAVRAGAYVVALKRWRTTYPNVDAATLRVTAPRCAWEAAR